MQSINKFWLLVRNAIAYRFVGVEGQKGRCIALNWILLYLLQQKKL